MFPTLHNSLLGRDQGGFPKSALYSTVEKSQSDIPQLSRAKEAKELRPKFAICPPSSPPPLLPLSQYHGQLSFQLAQCA